MEGANMKIPKKINILGFEYKIIQEETETMMRNGYWGTCNSITQEIHLKPDVPEISKLDTLIHEIIHAIDWQTSGKNGHELTEEQTQHISTGLTTVLRNNKVEQWL